MIYKIAKSLAFLVLFVRWLLVAIGWSLSL